MKFQVDLAALTFGLIENRLCVLLTKKCDAGPSDWSLPSTSLTEALDPEVFLSRFVGDLGVEVSYIEQLYTFLNTENSSIKMAYIVLARQGNGVDLKNPDTETKWISAKRIPSLEGINSQIKEVGIQRLRNKISYSRIATRLLDAEFTLTELMNVYEQILDESLDKRNFRKKIESKKLAVPTEKYRQGIHRPARLYRRGPKSKNLPL